MDPAAWDTLLGKIGAVRYPWIPIGRELSEAKKNFEVSGKGVSWSDVEKLRKTWRSDKPFIDSDGKPFVLYIYDQAGNNYRQWGRYGRNFNGQREYKFHFCWCQALQTMSSAGRGARYKQKKDVENDMFTVNRGGTSDEKIQMRVCKFCLSQMSYQGYSYSESAEKKDRIYNAFQISQFFKEHVPAGLVQPTHPHHTGRYPDNWPEISRNIKAQRGNKCEECGTHVGELHVHHINGVKDDCRPSNLKVLCRTCHAKQPMHEHMRR